MSTDHAHPPYMAILPLSGSRLGISLSSSDVCQTWPSRCVGLQPNQGSDIHVIRRADLLRKAEHRVELSATVSEAVADAFENAKALRAEDSGVAVTDIAGAQFVSRYHRNTRSCPRLPPLRETIPSAQTIRMLSARRGRVGTGIRRLRGSRTVSGLGSRHSSLNLSSRSRSWPNARSRNDPSWTGELGSPRSRTLLRSGERTV